MLQVLAMYLTLLKKDSGCIFLWTLQKNSQNTYFKDDLQTTVSESSYVTASNDTCSVKK